MYMPGTNIGFSVSVSFSSLKPIFHQAYFGYVRVNNAIDFALGTFQIIFTQIKI